MTLYAVPGEASGIHIIGSHSRSHILAVVEIRTESYTEAFKLLTGVAPLQRAGLSFN